MGAIGSARGFARGSASEGLSVGDVARRAGVTVSTLHFYEQKGLIKSQRSAGNQRRFQRDILRRVAVIKIAQRVGVPLADIKAAFSNLPKGRTPTAEDWRRLSAQWREDLDQRIAALTGLRNQLSSCIGCGCLSLKKCQLRNPQDSLANRGTGAQLLERG